MNNNTINKQEYRGNGAARHLASIKVLLLTVLLIATVVGSNANNVAAATATKTALQSDTLNYLHFVSLKGGDTLRLDKKGSLASQLNAQLEYSTDNRQNWTNYTWNNTTGASVAFAHAGDTVWFRAGQNGTAGTNANFSQMSNQYYKFVFGANDSIAAGGNIMSLYDGLCQQDTMSQHGFYFLFKDCKGLKAAPSLPATQLVKSCYHSMFEGCTSLSAAPSLPAVTLANACYQAMFSGCTSLSAAPSLQATQLATGCYNSMFSGCTSLKVDTCAGSCTGALLVVPNPATAPSIWNKSMFAGCQGDSKYTAENGIKLGGRYCISEYVEASYTIIAVSNNPAMGQVLGAGRYETNTPVTLVARPADHYHFVGWSNGATNDTITFTATADTTIVATFAIDRHALTVAANDPALGTANGSGEYDYGTSVILSATPANSHISFKNWEYMGRNVGNANPFSVVDTNNATYTAVFEYDNHTVTAAANDPAMGTVAGGGEYVHGTAVTLTATANEHYHFVNWSNGSTYNPLDITVTQDSNLTATFAIDQHTITAVPNFPQLGTITGSGSHSYNSVVTLVATPAPRYYFAGWSNGQRDSIISWTVTKDSVVVANFRAACGYDVSDQDGNTYTTVKIGARCWTRENLSTLLYMQDNSSVANSAVYYSVMNPDTTANLATYGRLYSWYSAVKVPENDNNAIPVADYAGNVQGICPTGWHLPSQCEMQALLSFTAPELKSTQTWIDNSGNNEMDFNAVAAGYYNGLRFENLGGEVFFWSSTRSENTYSFPVCSLQLGCTEGHISQVNTSSKVSVRCIQD